MSAGDKNLVEFVKAYKSLVVIPDTSLDSLLAAGLLFRKLSEHDFDVRLSLNAKLLIDYPSDPAIVIGIPSLNKQNQLSIGVSDESSVTAVVASALDRFIGIDKWDKLLAVLAGLYRGLYDFKSGTFKGIENTYARELVTNKVLHEVAGLRLWGAKRRNLVNALTRTLMPFIPGITGNATRAQKLVSEVFEVSDPSSVKQKELYADESKERALTLIKIIVESARDPQLAFKLLGDFYISLPDLEGAGEIEACELMGSLVVYESSCSTCPMDLALIPLEKSLIPQIMRMYERLIDRVSSHIAHQIDRARAGEPVSDDSVIKRPDIIVDVLLYMDLLPKGKAIRMLLGREQVTVLRELIRIGVRPDDAYILCGDDQLCPAK